uniref:Uncharacterized protein n=1 Tax=Utricularia reniformis TaxID=192314 RepID=A0A1Y0B1E2_9LAMI|nr:hypothetical protein AEK19_MT0971 [Utricularia reniformis]ART31194.1 hypothetical protein AEK19_MT0971 [Utricularia reniformis]
MGKLGLVDPPPAPSIGGCNEIRSVSDHELVCWFWLLCIKEAKLYGAKFHLVSSCKRTLFLSFE